MVSKILMVDPKGVILSGGQQVVSRHQLYDEALKKKTENLVRLCIVSKSGSVPALYLNTFEDSIKIIHGNILKYASELLRIVKNDKTIKAIVVGDPWDSFLLTKICLLASRRKIPVQVQIHADIGEPKWRKIQLRNLLKYYFAKISLPFADQIRTVSDSQTRKILDSFKVKSNKIVVIPVVSGSMSTFRKSNSKTSTTTTIGLVGRIEVDRGLHQFLDIISKLCQTDFHFQVLIIGKGSKSTWLKNRLVNLVGKSNVEMTGWLQGEILTDKFAQVDILISVAQSESYGRAIREALSLGLGVLTTKSSGVDDLLTEQRNLNLSVLSGEESGMELVEIMEEILNSPHRENSAAIVLDEGIHIEFLIVSWINLCLEREI